MRGTLSVSGLTFIVATSALWLGCAGQPRREEGSQRRAPVIAQLDKPFQLSINETAELKSENMRITFLAVTEDSRCPEGTICIWEGQATVLLAVFKDGKELGKYSLTSRAGHRELAVERFDKYSLELMLVMPYPRLNEEITDKDYIITLVVSRI